VLTIPEIERALVVMAHPDDVDFGSAGTVATLTDGGVHVTYCLVTDGDAGGTDRSMARHDMAMLRREEQTAAANAVGVTDLVFLGHGDGRVQPTLQLRADISAVIRRVRPRVVITQSPVRNLDRIYASHPDHLAAGEAAMCAVYPDARNPFAYADLADLEAWSVPEVWVMGSERTNRYVDITDAFERKKAALLEHASQMEGIDDLDALLRGWNGENARLAGMPEGHYAEGFWVMETG